MKKILIADDDMDLRFIVRDFLEASGYVALQASEGNEALTLIRRENPDLLILDLAMPIVDGWEVARNLRLSPAYKKLPIIALTAHAMPEDCQRALRAGCDSYLSKPFAFPELLVEINRLLAGKKG